MLRFITILFSVIFLQDATYAYEYIGRITGRDADDRFGTAVCTVDFNRDGFLDLLISAPNAGTTTGEVYIFLGGLSADTVVDQTLVGAPGSHYGESMCSNVQSNAWDVSEIMVGAPFYDSPLPDVGAVFQYRFTGSLSDTAIDQVYWGTEEGGRYGAAVSIFGSSDRSKQLYSIGIPFADNGSLIDAGKVRILRSTFAASFVREFAGLSAGDHFGSAVAGFFNLSSGEAGHHLLGAPDADYDGENSGRAYIIDPTNPPDTTIASSVANQRLGAAFAIGNVSGSSDPDIIIGSPGFLADGFGKGKIQIHLGAYIGSEISEVPDFIFTRSGLQHDSLGYAICSDFDINEDGWEDLLVGMPGNSELAVNGGGAVLLLGGDSLVLDGEILMDIPNGLAGKAVSVCPNFGSPHSSIMAVASPDFDGGRGCVHLYRRSVPFVNSPPIITTKTNPIVVAETNYTQRVLAVDVDGDSVVITATNLPPGSQFVDNGWDFNQKQYYGTFSWNADLSQVGIQPECHFTAVSQGDTTTLSVTFSVSDCLHGDANRTGSVNISDAIFIISYIFGGGAAPPSCEGDANCSDTVNISDAVYIIMYIFNGGPRPYCPS